MAKPKRTLKSPVDTINPKNKSELKRTFNDTLKDEVEKMALKHEMVRLHNRQDNIISQGIGGEELDLFEEDYNQGYNLSKTKTPKTPKTSKKTPESKVFLHKVSEKIEYKTNNKR